MNSIPNTGMNDAAVLPFVRNEVHFGFDLAPGVNSHLQRAAASIASRDDSLMALIDAQESAPDQLEVLIALYKFYFYQGEMHKAEELVFQTLIKSSLQGGFNHYWLELTEHSADWNDPCKPGRAYLYSLKALAFIRLRQNDLKDAHSILNNLQRLDPEDQVGAEVIRDLLAGLKEEKDDG